ncbi:MAG: DUF58 domain-containing protein [Spirochaetaceae bacterium]|nr:DUF58 domain-containing protein [Spirochaetaceae bacterium]
MRLLMRKSMTVFRKKQGPATTRSPLLFACSTVLLLLYLFAPWYFIRFVSLFMLIIIISAKLWSEYLVRSIKIRRREADLREFRREWANIEIIVENRGLLPALMLSIQDSPGKMPVFRENRSLCSLGARSRFVLRWQVYCADRGIWLLGPATVRGSDPLGLFPFSLTAPQTLRLFVYPCASFAHLPLCGGVPLGTLRSPYRLHEDLTRYRSLRPYHEGDELRRINWKITARTGVMTVNDYEPTGTFPLCLFLNLMPSAYPVHKCAVFTERVIEAAAALCLMAARERQELGIMLYDGQPSIIMPSPFTLTPILERLAAWRYDDKNQPTGTAALCFLERGRYLSYGTRYIYVGPNLRPEEYAALNSLRRQHLSVEYCILDEEAGASLMPGLVRRHTIQEYGSPIIER